MFVCVVDGWIPVRQKYGYHMVLGAAAHITELTITLIEQSDILYRKDPDQSAYCVSVPEIKVGH